MTALEASGSFAMVDPAHVAAIGPAAAILYARIHWRAQQTGEWAASRQVLAHETGLSPDMIRTALRVLQDREWVTKRRASADDATSVWKPVVAGQPDMGDSPTTPGEIPHMGRGDIPTSSYETDKTTPCSPPELFAAPALAVVPDPKTTKSRAKPKTTLPEGFRPTQAHWDLARSLDVDLSVQGPLFADHHTAAGSRYSDWNAALRTWIRKAASFAAERSARYDAPRRIVPAPDATYDPAYEATLPPPPRRDLFG